MAERRSPSAQGEGAPLAAGLAPTARFGDRARDYVRARPGYPPALLGWAREALGLVPSWRVADVGAGTGISARLFLEAGCAVTAVEPNAAMRAAAEQALSGWPGFRAVDAAAEATGLADGAFELVAAAQAFHWFDREAARREWRRILAPGGLALVFWNDRRTGGTAFLEGYQALLDGLPEYAAVEARRPDPGAMRAWFGGGLLGEAAFAHRQELDWEGLLARFFSSSYTPREGDPARPPLRAALRRLFDAEARGGRVALEYETQAWAGRP
jgi:SAM-dependent methyltransferase